MLWNRENHTKPEEVILLTSLVSAEPDARLRISVFRLPIRDGVGLSNSAKNLGVKFGAEKILSKGCIYHGSHAVIWPIQSWGFCPKIRRWFCLAIITSILINACLVWWQDLHNKVC